MEDPRDDEIARLRAGLRRATQAAMAYAELSSKRIAELKGELAHRAETDAATIEALRDALAEARAANESSPSTAALARDERVRALERRLAEVELERDDAARSLAERVAADECTAARDDEEEDEEEDARRSLTARSSEETSDDAERALESARRRCERAEKALDAFRLEGMALAAEAERASLRNETLERFVKGAREDVARARETCARRARVRADV